MADNSEKRLSIVNFFGIFAITLDKPQKKSIIEEQQKTTKNIAGLCNGSTADSDSVCEGSSPSPAAKKASAIAGAFFNDVCLTANDVGFA